MYHGTQMKYLPDIFDRALIGTAECKGVTLPCYGYQAMKVMLAKDGATPEEVYTDIGSALQEDVLVLLKLNKNDLWSTIRRLKYPRWDLLDRAVVGLGLRRGTYTGVVYDKGLSASILEDVQAYSDESASAVHIQMETSIIPTDLGTNTPWFVTRIN